MVGAANGEQEIHVAETLGDVRLETALTTEAKPAEAFEESHVGPAVHAAGQSSPTYWGAHVALGISPDIAFDRLRGWPVHYNGVL